MIREVYIDFIKNKLAEKEVAWVFRRAVQYLLIRISFLIKRPLCGPILGTLVTNYTCNYRCEMCDLPSRDAVLKKQGLKELTTQQMKAVLKDFASLGVSGIGFTGGEPLLRKDIFELIKYTKELGMITHLNTNAFFLDNDAIEKLFSSGTDSLNISLDGAVGKTHDSIRRHDGAFDRVITAVKTIDTLRKKKNSRLRLKLVAVIGNKNIDEIPEFIKLSSSLGVDCVEFIPQQPFVNASHPDSPTYDHIFMDKLKEALKFLAAQKRGGIKIENSLAHLMLFERSFRGEVMPFKCFAGYNSYAVDCYGEIYPCVPWFNWDKSSGNIADKDLKSFWYSAKYNKVRQDILKCRGCFLNCQAELNLLFK